MVKRIFFLSFLFFCLLFFMGFGALPLFAEGLYGVNPTALVFQGFGGFWGAVKGTFESVVDVIGTIGFPAAHTVFILPLNEDISEGGLEDILISEIDNVYLRVTFEGIGDNGAPRITLKMIQKLIGGAGVLSGTTHVIELEGLDIEIAEGESIEMGLTGTDVLLSLTLNGVQNGVPNITVDLVQ